MYLNLLNSWLGLTNSKYVWMTVYLPWFESEVFYYGQNVTCMHVFVVKIYNNNGWFIYIGSIFDRSVHHVYINLVDETLRPWPRLHSKYVCVFGYSLAGGHVFFLRWEGMLLRSINFYPNILHAMHTAIIMAMLVCLCSIYLGLPLPALNEWNDDMVLALHQKRVRLYITHKHHFAIFWRAHS